MTLDREFTVFSSVILIALGAAIGGCVTSGTLPADDSPDAMAPSSGGATGTMACSGASCVGEGACRPGQASAQFRKQTPPPDDLRPGARGWASVTFDNCSGKTWIASTFALRPAPPSDDATWGLGRVSLPT